VDRLVAAQAGRVEVSGRWYGIRGRRFVRPTLILTIGGEEHSALADLADKPWAAQDGDLWQAAFPVDVTLKDATVIELAVAPDITVALRGRRSAPARRRPASLAGAFRPAASAAASTLSTPAPPAAPSTVSTPAPPAAPSTVSTPAPPAGAEAPAPVPSAPPVTGRTRAADPERIRTKLAAAEQALERERERRTVTEGKLDEERAEGRRLRAQLGTLQAKLELADAARAEADAAAAELEEARRELEASQRRHDALRREHRQAVDAHAEARTALHERSGALESARTALAQERAETGQLRARLDGTRPTAPGRAGEPETVRQPGLQLRPRSSPAPESRVRPGADPEGRVRPGADPEGRMRPGADPEARMRPGADPAPETRLRLTSGPQQRPLNPSLRHRTWWLGRVLVLLVILGVIAAIIIVINSTVSHG
jgi:hypothetical protein